jgi:nucleoside-diphosphate-sugar epimerase
MSGIKVIITGATGMVGEGVLFECLQNAAVTQVLMINRRHYDLQHPKLSELLVPDFFELSKFADNLQAYNACFFCAGVTSIGKKEPEYTKLTYDTTLAFAKALLQFNNDMVFTYVSGSQTDSSEKGRLMWARVKGRTENHLSKLGFRTEYNFRPGVMLPFKGQKNWKSVYKFLGNIIKFISPKAVLTMHEVGKAMINCATIGYSKNVLEISDIKALASA